MLFHSNNNGGFFWAITMVGVIIGLKEIEKANITQRRRRHLERIIIITIL